MAGLGIRANLIGAAPTLNAGNNIGAAFSYFSEWDYIRTSTFTGWQTYGTCYKMNYLYYYTNYAAYLTGASFLYSYKRMSGLVCPLDSSVAGLTTAQLTVSNGYLPSKWGKKIPGFGAYSQNTGQLLYYRTNDVLDSALKLPLDLDVSGSITLPPAGDLLVRSVGEFIIPLPAPLDGNTLVTITGASPPGTNVPFLQSALGTCGIFLSNRRLPISCIHTSVPTQLTYTLIISE